jgi:hypothetical protein
MYPFHVANNDCFCERFATRDKHANVAYVFSAQFLVDGGIRSTIVVEIRNNTADTLDLTQAYVRVRSRNIPYPYNDRSLPVTVSCVPPSATDSLTLVGEAAGIEGQDPWLKIAGEEMTLTLKGMRLGRRAVQQQVVRFIPVNPKLRVQS